jgi:hypothetical protein
MRTLSIRDNDWTLERRGPVILLTIYGGQLVLTLQVSYSQPCCAVLTRWDLDEPIRVLTLEGTWEIFWQCFLDWVPAPLQAPVAHSEMVIKY